jgi:hypothetical protein
VHNAPPRHFSDTPPVELVLERLRRPRRSGTRWMAPCPAHDDKYPSLSIGEGSDQRALLHCFAGCTIGEITRAIGLEVADLFELRAESAPSEHRGPARHHKNDLPHIPLGVFRRLVRTPEFSFTWRAAGLLARLDPPTSRELIVQSWGYLIARCDIGLLLQTAHMIRGVAMYRYCDAKTVERPAAIADAVKRLVEEVER